MKELTCLFAGFVVVVGMSCWTIMLCAAADNNTTMVVNVGVVLDLSIASFGKVALSCIDMSLSDFYASRPRRNTTIVLHVKDSMGDVVEAVAQAMELIQKSEVETILGAETLSEAYFIMKLGEKAEVPILSFAPTVSTLNSPYFFQVHQNHSFQVHAISDIIKAFKWQQVVAIYQADEFGNWLVPDLINALQDMYIHVHRSVLNSTTSTYQIKQQLHGLSLMRAARVFVVHLAPNLASRVFATADELGMMSEGYAWILTDATANVLSSLNSSILSSMQGVLGLKSYIPRTREIHNFIIRWRSKFERDNPSIDHPEMGVYGLWAYGATRALAIAVERIGTDNPNLTLNGKKIRESLLKTEFKGLNGESSNLEIVNVIGNRGIRIGYWKPGMGLSGEFNRKEDLKTIIWPGYSVSAPTGWEILTNSKKKLRIGVAVNDEFSEFARVDNGSMVGYCIDIFVAVVGQLPYPVSYQFVPFEHNFSSSSSYDNLIMQVFEQKYDGAIGDITILANRSLYVDFTLPFTEAGIRMVVPVKQNIKDNHAWLFLKPLNLSLCFSIFHLFVLVSLNVCILEQPMDETSYRLSFRQACTSLFFSFCTIIFAQWEKLTNNLSRLVVVVWYFLLFVLAQSYTASLTSWLTVQQLQPVTDMNHIIKNNWHVGYQNGSYVFHTLQRMGIKNLVPYSSLEQLHQLFANVNRKGGIHAAIDEIPYMKLFLSKYQDHYVMVDSVFKSNGFGFAFSSGSSIVEDMSKAVLNVTESNKIMKIEEKWFEEKICDDESCSPKESFSLDLSYFSGLYVIVAYVAMLTFNLKFFILFYNKKRSQLLDICHRILNSLHINFQLEEGRQDQGAINVESLADETSLPQSRSESDDELPDSSDHNPRSSEPMHG